MAVDVFKGANGDLVLCQERPTPERERYTRIIVEMKDAKALAETILSVVDEASK